MINFRVIPKLEVKDFNLVKGIKLEGLRALGDPLDFLKIYEESGADEIIVEDVMASILEKLVKVKLISQMAKNSSIPISVAGGIKSFSDAEKLFSAGSERLILCSGLVKKPNLISDIADKYGSQSMAVKVEISTNNNRFLSLTYLNGREPFNMNYNVWLQEIESRGAGEIHINFIDLDGTGAGPNLKIFEKARKLVRIPLIYSGGVSSIRHIKDLMNAGADGVAIASSLHYHLINMKKVEYKYEKKFFTRKHPNADLGNFEWLFYRYGRDIHPNVDVLDLMKIKSTIPGLRLD